MIPLGSPEAADLIRMSRGWHSVIDPKTNPRLWEAVGSPNNDAIWTLARNLERENERLSRANAILVRWKGEIDSYLIAHRVDFPEDYDNSPKWAIDKLIKCGPL